MRLPVAAAGVDRNRRSRTPAVGLATGRAARRAEATGVESTIAESTIAAEAARAARAALVLGDQGVRTLGFVMAHLLAVVALDTCDCQAVSKWPSESKPKKKEKRKKKRKKKKTKLTVARLRAIFAHMAELVTVAALHLCNVQRLRAVLGNVAFLVAVAATAAATTTLRAVTGEVTD
ncbi:hypothetical protein BT67DRAFT_27267 [Trichocladium antarcticum]|uniref:Uncharacterized protein n=1 Tax=Trichocladium antarcticum TaxID=1450529 RepID=A0AAN6ZH38_9PEZI|nr:hypothetical protein BT67DRAFT_27267 [Trichocladium antarcticum]